MAKRIDSVTPPTELPKRQYHKGLYGANTPLALVELIESEVGSDPEDLLAYHRRRKLTIQYGNPLSGKAWAGRMGKLKHRVFPRLWQSLQATTCLLEKMCYHS